MGSGEPEKKDVGEEQDRPESDAGGATEDEDVDPTTQPIQAPEGERGAEADL